VEKGSKEREERKFVMVSGRGLRVGEPKILVVGFVGTLVGVRLG